MKKSIGTKIFNAVNFIYLSLLSLAMFIPFVIVLSVSFSSENAVNKFGYTLWPHEFSVDAYKLIFESGTVFQAYGVSIFVTVVGTAIAVLITAMVGYAISRKYLRYRNVIALLFYFSMLFSGGLVPWYITVTKLGLKNTIWALIFPMCFAPFNMLLIRNFFQTLPDALVEPRAGRRGGDAHLLQHHAAAGVAGPSDHYPVLYARLLERSVVGAKLYRRRGALPAAVFAAQGAVQRAVRRLGHQPAHQYRLDSLGNHEDGNRIVTIGPIIRVSVHPEKYFIKGITVGAVKG